MSTQIHEETVEQGRDADFSIDKKTIKEITKKTIKEITKALQYTATQEIYIH